jgi:hypothetical protein
MSDEFKPLDQGFDMKPVSDSGGGAASDSKAAASNPKTEVCLLVSFV